MKLDSALLLRPLRLNLWLYADSGLVGGDGSQSGKVRAKLR